MILRLFEGRMFFIYKDKMIFLSERHKNQAFFVSLQYTKQGGTVYDYNVIECGTFSPAQYYCRGRIVDAEGRESRYAPRQTERDGRNRVYRQRGNPERD